MFGVIEPRGDWVDSRTLLVSMTTHMLDDVVSYIHNPPGYCAEGADGDELHERNVQ